LTIEYKRSSVPDLYEDGFLSLTEVDA